MKGAPYDKKPGLTFDKRLKDKSGVKGNTLDYYNDDMSRKAVGKLFNDKNTDQGDNLDDDFVGDFEAASERGKSSSASPRSSKAGEPSIPDETGEFIDLDELETYIQKKNVNIASVFSDTVDNEYDISLYQDKKKGTPPATPPSKPAPSNVKPAPRPAPAGSKDRPASSKYPSGGSKAGDKSPGSRFKLNSADYGTDTVPKAAIVSSEISSQIKVAAFVIIIVFLAILAALIYKMNSLSASLEKANEIVQKYDPDMEQNYTRLQVRTGDLENEVKRLQDELELAMQNPPETDPPTTIDPNNQEQPTSNPGASPTTTPSPGQQQGERTHTAVRGDTLYGISIQYYGSSQYIKNIKEANGMTSDSISVGDVIKIPQL